MPGREQAVPLEKGKSGMMAVPVALVVLRW